MHFSSHDYGALGKMFACQCDKLMISAVEISDMTGSVINWMKVLLEIFDYITLVVFVMEILVKWLDGFFIFWKNGWNVFDFFVTAMVTNTWIYSALHIMDE